MKKCLFILNLFVIACSSDDEVKEEVFNDPDWLKLEIPNGREAYAIAGSLDDTLIVTTWTKAYYTVDEGKTWIESFDFQGPVMGLLEVNDTIFSLSATGSDELGNRCASLAQRFTLNMGNTWKYTYHPNLVKRIGFAESLQGTEYYLKENLTPTAPGASSFYVNPTDVMKKSTTGIEENISFPYKHNILNLYVDSDDRLYIAASGGQYQEETNTFLCCEPDWAAIVYVSRKSKP